MSALLEVRELVRRFGGLNAVDGVDLDVNEGEILSVIGPNGAGKTTLFNVVTGLYVADEGTIHFDGHDLVGLQPNHICTLGIARTFQTVRLFPAMTVLENTMVGQHCRTRSGVLGAVLRLPGTRAEERRVLEQSRSALSFFSGDSWVCGAVPHAPTRRAHASTAARAAGDQFRTWGGMGRPYADLRTPTPACVGERPGRV